MNIPEKNDIELSLELNFTVKWMNESYFELIFAKKWFIQYSIQYCFTQDSIQNIIQFKNNSTDSIQKIIQFNSQGIIDTGQIGKVPKKCPK